MVNIVNACLHKSRVTVRVGRSISEAFSIHNGLKQGDVMPPLLFNVVMEYLVREMRQTARGGTPDKKVLLLPYADDLDITSERRENMVCYAEALIKAVGKVRLDMNEEKTKYIVSDR